MNKTTLWVLVFAVVVIAVGAWVFSMNKGDSTPNPTVNPPAAENPVPTTEKGSMKEFIVTGQDYSFTPAVLSVKKGDTVKITFKNTDGMHDLRIDEFNVATKRIRTNETDTVTFVADKVSTFEYYCSVGNHRAMGMKGTLTVTE